MIEQGDLGDWRLEPFRDSFNDSNDAEESSSSGEENPGVYHFPQEEESEYNLYSFYINAADFRVRTELEATQRSITTIYPSKIDTFSETDILDNAKRIADYVEPQNPIYTQTIFIYKDQKRVKIDLVNTIDEQSYENLINNPDLEKLGFAFSYQIPLANSFPPIRAWIGLSLMLKNEDGIIEESVKIKDQLANHLDGQFAGELLTRHRGYVEDDANMEITDFKDKMKYICNHNPQT